MYNALDIIVTQFDEKLVCKIFLISIEYILLCVKG